MNVVVDRPEALMPVQAVRTDDPERILQLAQLWCGDGPLALATLVEIRGGASKPLGSLMAIAGDGRFCGYVSGGCVEAAVASEALLALEQGRDRMVSYGEGSPYFDIVLPCGGGITVAIHVLRDVAPVRRVLQALVNRQQAGFRYNFATQSLQSAEPTLRSKGSDGDFTTVFRPRTRLMISGQSLEADAVADLAEASGYDVIQWHHDEPKASASSVDEFTAVVLLHHDLESEAAILGQALLSAAFYIGALGSSRTHRRRTERLLREGHDRKAIDRIRAPIGLFGPARDSTSLALSILADIAAARLAAF